MAYSAFIFAGTDTTSSALTRVLYVLAAHPEAQAKLRKELKEARTDGQELSYDDVVSLPYMDAVCRETLRLCVHSPSFGDEGSFALTAMHQSR